jgi:hypothetical protein
MPGSQFVYLAKIKKNHKKISIALIITIEVLYDLSKVDLLFVVMATIT